MSLRADVHSAFDDIAPSTFGLPERVVQTVADARGRPRGRASWIGGFRAPLSLVAAFLLIALVVGALVGGRLLNDWKNSIKPVTPVGVDQAQLRQLEARPWVIPPVKPGAPCPAGPWDSATGWYGNGPVYGEPGPSVSTRWGTYFSIAFDTDPSLRGPVLIRARVLDTNETVIFVGDHAVGPVVGSDNLQGQVVQQHTELVLDTSHPPAAAVGGYVRWKVTSGLAGYQPYTLPVTQASVPNPICAGWQIDYGAGFTEIFVAD